ncbi:MAG: hypothetical protein J5985_09690, partial [Kiritimatiellae bacterium]|nr:hypothetical protein [Kiritimatiellia bacterium]
MSDIPPKHTPGPVPFENTSGQPHETGVVAMYNAASSAGAEPFPVLKAFQDYIESERAQARRRIAYLSVIFSLVIILVVAGFFVIGLSMFNNMSSLQARLLEAALRPQPQPAPQPVQPAAVVVQPAQQPQQPTVATLPPEVSRKLESLTAMAETVKKDKEDELARLREQMLAVQKQNEAMQKQNEEMQKQMAKEKAAREEEAQRPHYNERG